MASIGKKELVKIFNFLPLLFGSCIIVFNGRTNGEVGAGIRIKIIFCHQ
jgi:hypothetical protein